MLDEAIEFLKNRKKMNLAIVIANVLIFIVMEYMGDTEDVVFMEQHGAMYAPAVIQQGEYYRLFTSMFLHFGLEHLLYNMMLLIFAGDMLESRIGAVKYLIIYLGGGLAGSALSFGVMAGQEYPAVAAGASGAIFAVIGALVWIVVYNRGQAKGIDSKGLIVMAALSLAEGFMVPGVDHFAHLGGFLGGFLLAIVLRIGSHPCRRTKPGASPDAPQ